MRHLIGSGANGTGDINFAAACMAVGIDLDPVNPAMAVKADNGRDYGRFYLTPVSIDGTVSLELCNQAWNTGKVNPSEKHGQGFQWVMDFIQARPRGVTTRADWLAFAHDHLREHGGMLRWGWPKQLDEIPPFVAKNPETRAGYVFAFVYCRSTCLELIHRMGEDDPRDLITKGKSATMIREKASALNKKRFRDTIG